MQRLTILNTREIKKIKEILIDNFNHFPTRDYAFLKNEKNRIFIVNKDISRINLKNLVIDKVGLYFAEVKPNYVRLSKEGAQLLALDAARKKKKLKNVVILREREVKSYFQGQDLEKDLGEESKLILLQHQKDILGCAKYKEGQILNFLPKIHRGEMI